MPKKRTVETNASMQGVYDADEQLQRLIENRDRIGNRLKYWRGRKKLRAEEETDLRRMLKEIEKEKPSIQRKIDEHDQKVKDARAMVSLRKKLLYEDTYKRRHAELRKELGLPTLKAHA